MTADDVPDHPHDTTAVEVDEALVRRLLHDQLPHLEGDLRVVGPWGTDNAMFGLGDDLVVRLPRRGWAKDGVAKEARWLPELRHRVPFAVPEPVAVGRPSAGYPWVWAVYRWLPGLRPSPRDLAEGSGLGREVGVALRALHRVELASGPPPGPHNGDRGGAIRRRDRWVRPAIASERHSYDRAVLTELWEEALRLPPWPGAPRWLHGDLTPGNVLVSDRGRLTAVIDWGCLAVGDPACDLMFAWNLDATERAALREEVDVDDTTWARGRAAALWQWVGGLDDADPDNEARRVIERVVADAGATLLTSGSARQRSRRRNQRSASRLHPPV